MKKLSDAMRDRLLWIDYLNNDPNLCLSPCRPRHGNFLKSHNALLRRGLIQEADNAPHDVTLTHMGRAMVELLKRDKEKDMPIIPLPETEEAAFLTAVAEKPKEDGPRTVYADWLEEKGLSERAELIRLQCALEGPDAAKALERLQELGKKKDLLAKALPPWAIQLGRSWTVDNAGALIWETERQKAPYFWLMIHRGFLSRAHGPFTSGILDRLTSWNPGPWELSPARPEASKVPDVESTVYLWREEAIKPADTAAVSQVFLLLDQGGVMPGGRYYSCTADAFEQLRQAINREREWTGTECIFYLR